MKKTNTETDVPGEIEPSINNGGDAGKSESSAAGGPVSAEAWCRHGKTLLAEGRYEEGAEALKRAVESGWQDAAAYYCLGIALKGCGKDAEAVDSYMRALSLKPDYPEVLNDLGVILSGRGRLAEARVCLERAVKLAPHSLESLNNLGLVCMNLGRLADAEALFRRVLVLVPDLPEALNNLGTVLRLQNALEESLACCRRTLALLPGSDEAHANLGNILYDLGMLPEAISVLERAVNLHGDNPGLRKNLGMFLLTAGRFEEGWPEYEWRWQCEDLAASRQVFPQPRWRGETVESGVLFLHAEQGFGDAIQFCRFAPLAAARGMRVMLGVPHALVRLMKSLSGVERIIGPNEALPPFHFECPLMSLPLVFDTRLESIPARVPYLNPDESAVAAWRERLSANPCERFRVGLVWAGSARSHSPILEAVDRRRSVAPGMLAPLLDVPGVQFYSLQKSGLSFPAEFGLIDLMDECNDFADTAALIACLDLVISVDTAVAHLAGAMGKAVWMLNRFDTCWRWLLDRDDSPWYPTLRLFRQPRPGDWESVIVRVRSELERFKESESLSGPR